MMIEVMGIVGMSVILLFFVLNQIGIVTRDDTRYDVGNVIGSGLLVLYAISIDSAPFVILNVVWMLVSLRDVVKQIIDEKK